MAGFVLMLASVFLSAHAMKRREMPSAGLASMFLVMGGFTLSAALTASGLVAAYRSGMRVWIGKGVNQARTLLMAMLIVGFVFVALVPMSLWLSARFPRAIDAQPAALPDFLAFCSCLFVGPLLIVLVLDRISRRIIANRPGKFGPKVPTVGKWNT